MSNCIFSNQAGIPKESAVMFEPRGRYTSRAACHKSYVRQAVRAMMDVYDTSRVDCDWFVVTICTDDERGTKLACTVRLDFAGEVEVGAVVPW